MGACHKWWACLPCVAPVIGTKREAHSKGRTNLLVVPAPKGQALRRINHSWSAFRQLSFPPRIVVRDKLQRESKFYLTNYHYLSTCFHFLSRKIWLYFLSFKLIFIHCAADIIQRQLRKQQNGGEVADCNWQAELDGRLNSQRGDSAWNRMKPNAAIIRQCTSLPVGL